MTCLHYQQIGEQPEHLLLIHGLFGSLENLNMVAKPLSALYTVTSVDVRNHGSSYHNNDMNYANLAQDIIATLDRLNINSTHVLGHSMGGKIAMKTALSFPERVNKLVIGDISPVALSPSHLDIIAGLRAINFDQVNNRKDADIQLAPYVSDVGIRQFLLRNLITTSGKFSFKCHLENIAHCYPQILSSIESDTPFVGETLFIKGGNSNYILQDHKPAIAAIFPQAKAKIIQGAGHWLHAEKPNIFNKILTNFLSAEVD